MEGIGEGGGGREVGGYMSETHNEAGGSGLDGFCWLGDGEKTNNRV